MHDTKWVDLRSDTVTQPSAGMRAAMLSAPLGDDVFGDDPTVNRLQGVTAELLGFEAALLLPTGTQSNLAALMSHCGRGDEYLVGQEAHTYRYEAGGGAVLGSIQPQPITNQPDGSIALADIEAAIKPDDAHFARTRLLALENTIGGRVVSRAYLDAAIDLANRRGLATHLDGARLFNAATKLGIAPKDVCRGFDSVSVCLSKGLGTPAGTMLAGSKAFIKTAHRMRKMLGGAMRQAGVIAAAGLYALEYNVTRIADDHANAERLARGLSGIPGLVVEGAQTNMVFVRVAAEQVATLNTHMQQTGIRILAAPRIRLVTHLDVDAGGIDRAITAFKSLFVK
ncbi:MAG: low-specificity L-threonine aldolase [Betaproteobacteria bacterium]|nr:low-specificity L-threonine aldolase [Betaproteobacteria bacterium]